MNKHEEDDKNLVTKIKVKAGKINKFIIIGDSMLHKIYDPKSSKDLKNKYQVS